MARPKKVVEEKVEQEGTVEQEMVTMTPILAYRDAKFSLYNVANVQEACRDLLTTAPATVYFEYKGNVYAVRQAFKDTKVPRGAVVKTLNDKKYFRVVVEHFLRRLVIATLQGLVVDMNNIDPTTGEEYPF